MPASQFVDDTIDQGIINTMQNTWLKYQTIEQARWYESNIDLKFWAGDQDFAYNYFNYTPNQGWRKFFLNIIRQPCDIFTGYQRQHRKSYTSIPILNSDQKTSDQLNKVFSYANDKGYLLETFSDACEQAVNSAFCLLQPYLDFSEDFLNGELKLKIWEYNSFMTDPFFRDKAALSDCSVVWTQEYLCKEEAKIKFPKFKDQISMMQGFSNRDGQFYFLPENYNVSGDDLLVLSRYWRQTTRKKKVLVNRKTGEISNFLDDEKSMKEFVRIFSDFEIVIRDMATWRVDVVLNKLPIYSGLNPLGFDRCPFVPVYFNLDNHIPQYNLRARSLVRTLRDLNYLFNRRVILNHDISESSLNTGWVLEENTVSDENVLQKAGQGQNVHVKEGTPRENWPYKIVPNAVPPSDMELANQLFQLREAVSGVNESMMGMGNDPSVAGVVEMLRQSQGLVATQKYFDQWDMALKQVATINMEIIQNKWGPYKIQAIVGEPPTEQFFTKNFQQYGITIAEGLNTPIQRQQQFAQAIEYQNLTGMKLPPKYLLDISTLQGKDEIMAEIEQQEKIQSEMQMQQMQLDLALKQGDLELQKATTAEKLALARERTGRTKSNVGLFEERVAEVTKNRAVAIREKVLALKELLDTIQKYGEPMVLEGSQDIARLDEQQVLSEEIQKVEGKNDSASDLRSNGLTPPPLQRNDEAQISQI